MRRLSFIFILLFLGNIIYAQQVKAVLVQLSSEQNRISFFKKKGKQHDAIEIAMEAKKVRKATIMDFTDNFDYCPVYYFMDTNRDAIKNKHFKGILFDAKGEEVHSPVIKAADSDYIVVYYGYSADDKTSAPDHKSLVVLNDELQQVFVIFKSQMSMSAYDKDPGAQYTYMSPKYDIDYSAHAQKLNDNMEKVGRKLRKSQEQHP